MNGEDIEKITQSTNVISQWSIRILKNIGFEDKWINYFNLIFLLILLVVAVFALQLITRYILHLVFARLGKLPRMSFFNRLRAHRFPHFLAMIIPFSLVKSSIPIIFDQFPKLMLFADKIADIYLIFYVIWLIMSLINAFGDTLRIKESMRDKPIDSYIQVVKIVLYFIGFIILFSILSGKDPMVFITGLGALSAVLMLVFKDTIMGFVASIQVSVNDMVRIGDWITVPKHDADGDVVQITLTTVKIRNFDKTITTIPPYSLVSDSFQNWRGMQDSGGRRLKRQIFIKLTSVHFIKDEEIKHYEKIQLITDYVKERAKEIDDFNAEVNADKSLLINGRNLTNMGLYRNYIQNYLRKHPHTNKEMMIMVRQQPIGSKGIPLELYFFTDTTEWTKYESIVCDIFDHIVAAATYFQIELFEDMSDLMTSINNNLALE